MNKRSRNISHDAFASKYVIESISDMIEIISSPNIFLSEILNIDPHTEHQADLIGTNHINFPRPFPHGIWFRGQANADYSPIPQLFREGTYFEEADMFQNIKLSHSSADLRGFNNFELMCIMQHHSLPTRLLDWSENILISAYFAVERNFREYLAEKDSEDFRPSGNRAAIYVLNAFRLNSLSNVAGIKNAGIAVPYDIDVAIRSLMVEHTYLESVFSKILNSDLINRDNASISVIEIIKKFLEEKPPSLDQISDKDLYDQVCKLIYRMRLPIAVIPRRDHPRMDAQLSTFTVHGGKQYFTDEDREVDINMHGNIMDAPINLDELNNGNSAIYPNFKPFLMKFEISEFAIKRIMIELDRLGIIEPMIYPDIENQSGYVKRRWAIVNKIPRRTINLPQLKSLRNRKLASAGNYMRKLYNL